MMSAGYTSPYHNSLLSSPISYQPSLPSISVERFVSYQCSLCDDDDDDDELDNLYSAIILDSREYYTSRVLTTAAKKFETSVS